MKKLCILHTRPHRQVCSLIFSLRLYQRTKFMDVISTEVKEFIGVLVIEVGVNKFTMSR